MNKTLILAVALLLGLAINSATAQTIGANARHERLRLAGGVRSGELTRPEAYRLHREQRHIRRDIHRARKDGRIDRAERMHIRHEQKKHSRHIYRAKHNSRKRA